ncbi:cytochrome oxidase biogenesis protein Surf1 [Piscinibacter sakaiensis]|uniref:SURF1-like protein n=1 Tax=Piscinibacter sakaiensis TaxID=1547922 RepID=A0A0K8P119_PISS1|nr:cytochrome oxidase biogenesis protein Surf1 [Piscinibacter sakaiensis]
MVALAALVVAAGTARLGVWQLDRAAQKRALQAALDTRAAAAPLPQAELATDRVAAAEQHQRRILLQGRWLPERSVFLDNRQMDGRPGFFVLTPLQLEPVPRAAAPGSVIWVQRGWVPRDNDVRTRLPAVPTPPGAVQVAGRVAPPPARLYQFAADAEGPIRQNLDLDESARSLGRPVLPLTVVQVEAPPGGDGLRRDWPAPAADVQKHLGYAFQWFALCALVLLLYVWFQLIRPRRRRPPAD